MNNIKKLKKMYPWANTLQLEEIKLGLEKGLDVSIYTKPEFSVEYMQLTMEELKKELL